MLFSHLTQLILGFCSMATAFVANPDKCRDCHVAQHDFWQKTAHASAYLVLFSKNQHFDPDCASCHTLGLGAKGGFQRIAWPVELKKAASEPSEKSKVWVECFLDGVFSAEAKPIKALDSRTDPARYAELKGRYHRARGLIATTVSKDFMNVQCEHCHGDRAGHLRTPGKPAGTRPVFSESVCRKCHVPERDPGFSKVKIVQVACPKR